MDHTSLAPGNDVERLRRIQSVTRAVREYERASYKGWLHSPRPFINSLSTMRYDLLVAYDNVLSTKYLEPEMVHRIVNYSGDDTILLFNAHMEWLHKHSFEAQHLLNRATELGKFLGIEKWENGWHPTLEAHLWAEEEYHRHSGYRDHERELYTDNKDMLRVVETHAEHIEHLIPYMNSRRWPNDIDAQHFTESLEQHALKDGWL